jgi:electron transport complex protein RnfA
MPDLLAILLTAIFVNNFVLVKFLGLCPVMGVSRQLDSAIGLSLATAFVLTLASALSYLVYAWLLVPLGIEWLRTLAFILVIAALVQVVEALMRRQFPVLYQVLGIFLPLITTNCAVLGVALLNTQEHHDLLGSIAFGLGASIGFGLVLVLFAGLRERIDAGDVPKAFRGAPIGLLTAGLMSLAFMGFGGMGARG